MSRPATPKQVAYLTYMGLRNADRLSFDQASERIENIFDGEDANLQLQERRSNWRVDRIRLYPELYADERQQMLDTELPEVLHTYVRSQVVGASERLTKAKIKKVIADLSASEPNWWQNQDYKTLFFTKMGEAYPDCVDGRPPTPKAPQSSSSRKGNRPATGGGCLILVVGSLAAFHLLSRVIF